MSQTDLIFSKGTVVADRFEIQFPLESVGLVQSYRARYGGKIFRLDLLNLSSLSSTFFDENGKLRQVSLMKSVNHSNIPVLLEEGEVVLNNQRFAFLAYQFVSGETLNAKLSREGTLSQYEAVPLIIELLEILEYLHSLSEPLIHNGISTTSVIVDLSGSRTKPVLMGFEQARSIYSINQGIYLKGLSLFHSAPELLNGIFIPQSDLFSVGALLYQLLLGVPPWFKEGILEQPPNIAKGLIEQERAKQLNLDFADENEIDEHLKQTIIKALSVDIDDRFKSAGEFAKALKREVVLDKLDPDKHFTKQVQLSTKKKGAGFDQIAGMDELKELLYNDVIRAITEKERFAKYGIPMLNGLLLYGPPGCGKTFIAQKFAEEISFNFLQLKPSDLKSQYINATEGIISKLFKEAETNKPTIIFIDEFDALVPSREGDLHQMYSNAVNEILAQMTNCGERGIFVIAATNRPDKIDSAVKRAGRIDKIIYLPPPDKNAREGMFRLYLKDRHADLDINFMRLADLTEYYVSSDIKLLIDEASRRAERKDARINQQILETTIREVRPSVTQKEINKYLVIKQQWENEKQNVSDNSTPIGFRLPKDDNK